LCIAGLTDRKSSLWLFHDRTDHVEPVCMLPCNGDLFSVPLRLKGLLERLAKH
jgi:hypothetical protein